MKACAHVVGVQHLVVIAQRRARRGLGVEVDPRRAVGLGGGLDQVAAVRLHRQRAAVAHLGCGAGGVFRRRDAAGAEGRDAARAAQLVLRVGQHVAGQLPAVAGLLETVETGGHPVALRHREGGIPPARAADLVGRAERRDQKPHRGDQPDHHHEDDRDVHRPGQARLVSGDRVHQRISLRAWMMFQIITGSTMIMMTKATAVARPSSRNM